MRFINQLSAMVWKEWREAQALLWIGLGVMLGLPVIGAAEATIFNARRFEIFSSQWVISLGGVLAVLVAVGITCRDFRGGLEDFWRSRPLRVASWLRVKFFVGLLVVLLVCEIPLVAELNFNRDQSALAILLWYPFLWMALYGLGFLGGCVVRRMAPAAMLGLGAMLLVLLLPKVLPPLGFLDTGVLNAVPWPGWRALSLIDKLNTLLSTAFESGELEFAGAMLLLALLAAFAAVWAVKRDWRIESGPKLMYGSISLAVLILFSSAAFQLGTNMPVLAQIGLPAGERVNFIQMDGNRGYAITQRATISGVGQTTTTSLMRRELEVSNGGIVTGAAVDLLSDYGMLWDWWAVSPPGQPNVVYRFNSTGGNGLDSYLHLYCARLDKRTLKEVRPLWVEGASGTVLFIWQNHLYAVGDHLVVLDISDPLKPVTVSDTAFAYGFNQWEFNSGQPPATILLPPIRYLPARQRLEVAMKFFRGAGALEGDTFCVRTGRGLVEYRLAKLTDKEAVFEEVGEQNRSMLEQIFGPTGWQEMKLQNGLLYVMEWPSWNPPRMGPGLQSVPLELNPHISVFETRGAHPMELVGHFAAPGLEAVCPLSDGRAVVGGSSIWLVGAPPRRGD